MPGHRHSSEPKKRLRCLHSTLSAGTNAPTSAGAGHPDLYILACHMCQSSPMYLDLPCISCCYWYKHIHVLRCHQTHPCTPFCKCRLNACSRTPPTTSPLAGQSPPPDIRLDAPIHQTLSSNYQGSCRVVSLAARMLRLRSIVHLATCYTNINKPPGTSVEERWARAAGPSRLQVSKFKKFQKS